MIYQRIDFNSFQNAFDKAGRSEQFSAEGLKLLFDYVEDLHGDYELDVVGLCCQYAEYTLEEFLNDYKLDGVESTEDLERALKHGEIDCVMSYRLVNNIILVNNDY